jgi:hypothetical protein
MAKTLQKLKEKESIGRITTLVLIYFLYLYSFKLPGLPFGSVLPVLCLLVVYTAFMLITGTAFQGKLKTVQMLRSYLLWNVFLIIYVTCILQFYGSGNGITPINDYMQMLIILPLIFVSGNVILRNVEELMLALYIGVIIQSIIIIAALFLPTLTIFLFQLFPESKHVTDVFGGLDLTVSAGYNIGLGVFGSAGSLKLAMGQIAACYFLLKSRDTRLFYHLLIFLIISIATSTVSRTGLLISISGFLSVIIAKTKQGGLRSIGFVFATFLLIYVGYYIVSDILSSRFLGDTFQRIINTSEEGLYETYFKGFFGESGDNIIPPICAETIIGLGIVQGVSGSGITTITDGGFLRNYSAMGLIVAFFNYLIIAKILIKQYKAYNSVEYKGIILYIILIFLIGEFKQSFIYYNFPMCFSFLIFSLIEREGKNKFFIRINNTKGYSTAITNRPF